jgi:uncharacterized RDD family membrane protein YckC
MGTSAYTDQTHTSATSRSRSASGPRAGFGARLGAVIIDGVILAIPAIVLVIALKGPAYPVELLLSIAYFVYFEGGAAGQTPGKRSMGIRVVSLDSGGPIGYGRAFVRFVGRYVSAAVIYIGYLWMLWDSEKQCWHDKLASDVVVPVSDYPVAKA